MSSDIPVLSVRNLSVSYKEKSVVKNVSFDLRSGESIALVGESGCGKSTILRAVMRILPDQGRVSGGDIMYGDTSILTMHNAEWKRLSGRHIAMIFQQPGGYFDPIRKIGLQFKDFMTAHGVGKKEWHAMAVKCLMASGFLDAERILDSYAFQLSGGMQQRVAVARALVHNPKLVIADEPTGNIDPELSLEMMQLLERVSKMGITVLVVTHEHELVHRFHQRVVTLSHGRIVSDVPADPVAAAEDDLSLDVAAFDADDAAAAKKEVAAV